MNESHSQTEKIRKVMMDFHSSDGRIMYCLLKLRDTIKNHELTEEDKLSLEPITILIDDHINNILLKREHEEGRLD